MMSGDVSLGYFSHETSHHSFHHRNDSGISEDKSIEVSADNGICGNSSLDTIQSSTNHCRVFHGSDDGRVGSRSLDTSYSSSFNRVVCNFGEDGRVVSRSQ